MSQRCLIVFLLAGWPCAALAADPVRVLIWDEQQPAQKQAYGEHFLGETIAAHLRAQPGLNVTAVTIDSPEQGLREADLDAADVIVWWGHVKHKAVEDDLAERVVTRVLAGKLAFVGLHSAHWSKPFVRLMQERAKADAFAHIPEEERGKLKLLGDQPLGLGVNADTPLTPALSHEGDTWVLTLPRCVFPTWRADGEPGHITTRISDHPIAKGLPAEWDVAHTEMYGEPFHVPAPDEVVFEEKWDKGEHFRSGCVWQVGNGTVFYFRPGHETFAVYQQPEPLMVIENAVRWLGK